MFESVSEAGANRLKALEPTVVNCRGGRMSWMVEEDLRVWVGWQGPEEWGSQWPLLCPLVALGDDGEGHQSKLSAWKRLSKRRKPSCACHVPRKVKICKNKLDGILCVVEIMWTKAHNTPWTSLQISQVSSFIVQLTLMHKRRTCKPHTETSSTRIWNPFISRNKIHTVTEEGRGWSPGLIFLFLVF